MKKNVCLFVGLLFVVGCKSQEVKYSEDVPNESDLAIIDIHLGKDKNLLTFVDNFKEDSVPCHC
ncbi:hypothetical protein CJ739_1431 [Mariniflexile rhizosphaerae]|uniref:hypothetical protein n=1 Tax=unclassified Mariniflexile TaxID=2643887 RepID=UPI000CBD74D5|nr:hypothetical protein [Mariniflexile sp. TRM1-10]AXP80520.1 hypothetical protein CJ739_1431 [Mariniflexile sp. TRM1-10]PLB20062.1 MAG: hypothetical protein TRG1_1007 [Flavobacteriaceae bacterium FS1-H7996/R]